jgi:hypothetical protein
MADKNNEVLDQDTLDYLSSLDVDGTARIMNSPLTEIVLEAALHSSVVEANVNAVLDPEFGVVTPEERVRIDQIATARATKTRAVTAEAHPQG